MAAVSRLVAVVFPLSLFAALRIEGHGGE